MPFGKSQGSSTAGASVLPLCLVTARDVVHEPTSPPESSPAASRRHQLSAGTAILTRVETVAHDITPLHAERSLIVRELFVDTADDNYITARWCFFEALNVDYFWLAVHAIEKYMKAALLLNGHSAKGYRDKTGKFRHYRHNIVALYEQVRSFASDLLPSTLARPHDLDISHWRDETPQAFIQRFHDNGNADNRYQIFGFVQHREDLFKLDAMVFSLRRLCVPLDGYYMAKHRPGTSNWTYRDILTQQPDYWSVIVGCKLKKTSEGKRGEPLRDVLLTFNFPFAPDEFPHGRMRSRTSSQNPVLWRSILDPLQRAPDGPTRTTATQLRDWVLEKIPLPKDVAKELRQARTSGKT